MRRMLGISRVLSNRRVARDTQILRLSAQLEEPVLPGQFAMVHPLRAGCLLPRPFSILDAADDWLEILVKVVGKGSAALAQLREQEELRLFAPLGAGFSAPELFTSPAILVAGGVGIVPLHLLARQLRAGDGPAPTALFGARTPEDLPRSLFEGEHAAWQLWVEDCPESDMRQGLVTEGLREALQRSPQAVVATCGPTPMMRAVAEICAAAGRALWVCLEEQMGCGAGVCRACIVPDAHEARMRTVCKEGPVFAVDEIQFLEQPA